VDEDVECRDLCTFVNVSPPPPHPPRPLSLSLSLSLSKRGTIKTLFFVGISFASKKIVWALQGRVYRIMIYGHVLGFRV